MLVKNAYKSIFFLNNNNKKKRQDRYCTNINTYVYVCMYVCVHAENKIEKKKKISRGMIEIKCGKI